MDDDSLEQQDTEKIIDRFYKSYCNDCKKKFQSYTLAGLAGIILKQHDHDSNISAQYKTEADLRRDLKENELGQFYIKNFIIELPEKNITIKGCGIEHCLYKNRNDFYRTEREALRVLLTHFEYDHSELEMKFEIFIENISSYLEYHDLKTISNYNSSNDEKFLNSYVFKCFEKNCLKKIEQERLTVFIGHVAQHFKNHKSTKFNLLNTPKTIKNSLKTINNRLCLPYGIKVCDKKELLLPKCNKKKCKYRPRNYVRFLKEVKFLVRMHYSYFHGEELSDEDFYKNLSSFVEEKEPGALNLEELNIKKRKLQEIKVPENNSIEYNEPEHKKQKNFIDSIPEAQEVTYLDKTPVQDQNFLNPDFKEQSELLPLSELFDISIYPEKI